MRQPGVYPIDVSDEEWAFVAPDLGWMKEDAPQRQHSLRAVFNALRYMVRAGCPWRLLPNDLPLWQIVHQQATRWLAAGVFEEITHDLRMILRQVVDRPEQPTAAVLDARTAQGSAESGPRSGDDGHKKERCQGPLGGGHPWVSAGRACLGGQRKRTCPRRRTTRQRAGRHVDQGYNGAATEAVAAERGVTLQVVGLPEAKRFCAFAPALGG